MTTTDNNMMKTTRIHEYKNHAEQDWALFDVPKPTPADGQVLVKIVATSINPVDTKVVAGYIKSWAMPEPFTPGYDVSGVVEAVGAGVTDTAVGDEVWGVNWALDIGQPSGQHDDASGLTGGAFAEYIVMPEEKLSKKPAALSHAEAAAVALVGTTAMQGVAKCEPTEGKTVLVLAGATAVGWLAVQLLKQVPGVRVVTTSSPRTLAHVQEAGPDRVIDYTATKWFEDPELLEQRVDAVFDTIGEAGVFANAKKVLKAEGGAFVSIANFEAGADGAAHAPALKYAAFYCLKNNRAHQDELARLIVEGKLKVKVDATFPFTKEGVTSAFTTMAAGKSMGKNVITMETASASA